jgi:hypothetical protein
MTVRYNMSLFRVVLSKLGFIFPIALTPETFKKEA